MGPSKCKRKTNLISNASIRFKNSKVRTQNNVILTALYDDRVIPNILGI